jgi:hypothetical protein
MKALICSLLCVASLSCLADWKPLWDGKTLKGWHEIGTGKWVVENGAIHGTHANNQRDYGHLVSDRVYTNFTVRLKYKSVAGNSGLYFRIEEKGSSGVSGFQAEIDPDKDTGGLYETNGRKWVVKPKASEVKRWYKPGEWNEMSVTANGAHIVVHVNDIKTAELPNDSKGRSSGKLALQLHGGQNVDVWFKDIEIEEL